MHLIARGLLLAALCAPAVAGAQQRDSVPPAPADSAARADSLAADSIALVRELEAQAAAAAPAPPAAGGAGPTNPRLLPDISAVGDLLADLSPRGSTLEGGSRFAVREVEIALQAAVDPYFRGDIFLGVSDAEGASVEQAFLTTTALPWAVEAKLGRYLMPFGKANAIHLHALHTIEYPYVVRRFLGEEGLKGTGVQVGRIFAPFGFYQEVVVAAVDNLGAVADSLRPEVPPDHRLGGLGYLARLRNYWDLSEASNVEVGFSAMTGDRAQPVLAPGDEFNAVNARQSTLGADFTYRWRPLRQGLYRSLIVQAEAMRQLNAGAPALPAWAAAYLGPTRDYDGAYVFGRYQLGRRVYLGSRWDYLQDPELDGRDWQALSGYLEFYPSEFSKLVAGYEHRFGDVEALVRDRILVQANFAVGPHQPHPF